MGTCLIRKPCFTLKCLLSHCGFLLLFFVGLIYIFNQGMVFIFCYFSYYRIVELYLSVFPFLSCKSCFFIKFNLFLDFYLFLILFSSCRIVSPLAWWCLIPFHLFFLKQISWLSTNSFYYHCSRLSKF
jgi:hypothetical protein